MQKRPIAKLVTDQGCRAIWLIQWPSDMTKWGKSYYAITYPGSDLVALETAARRRPVSQIVGRKIMPQIVDAIGRARKAVAP